MIAPNKIPLSEVVKSLVFRVRDKLGLSYADYMSFAKDVWVEMNMHGLKDTKRVVVKVNRKINAIPIPEVFIQVSSVYIFRDGKIVPLLSNSKITDEIVDLAADKKCECGSDLCANIKNYELIEEQVEVEMPDGSLQVFTKTVRKKVNLDGSYVMEVNEPVKIYQQGIYVSVEMQSSEEYICALEVEENGCIKETKENRTKVVGACGFSDLRHECGCPTSPDECDPRLEYRIVNGQILLPSNHSYDHVIVRGYYDAKTRDILIPQVAKKNFMDRLFYAGIEYDMEVPEGKKEAARRAVQRSMTDMVSDLSRMTVSKLYSILSPKRIL